MQSFEEIELHRLKPGAVRFTYFRDLGPLEQSMAQVGLWVPIRVQAQSDGFEVLDGHQRLEAAQKLGWSRIAAVIQPSSPNLFETFKRILELNLWGRAFNMAEKAFVIRYSLQTFDEAQIQDVFTLLGLRGKAQTKPFLEFLKLPSEIQDYTVRKDLPLAVPLKFLRFPEAERKELFTQLSAFPINQNKWAEILDWLGDLSRKDSCSALSLIEACFKDQPGSSESGAQLDQLRQQLRQRRFPRLEKQRERFSDQVRELKLPPSVHIEPSPFFEETSVELKARLASPSDREALIRCLQDPRWDRFWEE